MRTPNIRNRSGSFDSSRVVQQTPPTTRRRSLSVGSAPKKAIEIITDFHRTLLTDTSLGRDYLLSLDCLSANSDKALLVEVAFMYKPEGQDIKEFLDWCNTNSAEDILQFINNKVDSLNHPLPENTSELGVKLNTILKNMNGDTKKIVILVNILMDKDVMLDLTDDELSRLSIKFDKGYLTGEQLRAASKKAIKFISDLPVLSFDEENIDEADKCSISLEDFSDPRQIFVGLKFGNDDKFTAFSVVSFMEYATKTLFDGVPRIENPLTKNSLPIDQFFPENVFLLYPRDFENQKMQPRNLF